MATTTITLGQRAQSGKGKLFDTGDELICVLQLQGSWYEMGQQYGALAKSKIEPMWAGTVQSVLDKKWMTEKEATELFGARILAASSTRRQAFYRGVADAMKWPVEKTVLLDQSGVMNMYQGKLHSFSGCTSLSAWDGATVGGVACVGRNLDWDESFIPYAVFLTVYNPTDGSNKVANVNFPGWLWALTALNDKGVYLDMHDGTSMGGPVISAERPSFMNQVFDFLAECDSKEAVSTRFLGTRTNVPSIWLLADRNGSCSLEATLYDNRRRNPQGDTLATVNSFLNPDWGLYLRDTVSNSLRRYRNIAARAAEAHGKIDAAKMREIFDLPLFNEDGTFKEKGGVTKPRKQDADLTNYQTVTDLENLEMWLKLPPLNTEWRHVDLKPLFGRG